MTHMESLMLTLCFSFVVGYTVGNLIGIVIYAINEHKEKKRREKESVNTRSSGN